MAELLRNSVFQASALAWLTAQLLKFFIELIRYRRINFRLLTSAGGMPSSHSASVSALALGIGLSSGFGTNLFVLALWFAIVTMYDAAGVRRSASIQAHILNQIIAELFQGHPISDTKLRELIGHTPIQVLAGMILGIVIALWIVG